MMTLLEQEIINQLKFHSYGMPVRRVDLAGKLRSKRLLLSRDDRAMRKAIEELRKKGFLVCHGGKDGVEGYYMAASKAEYEAFRVREYKSRIISLAETLREMDKAAEAKFGEEIQLDLFRI